jgi:hypothetical protein
MEDEGEEEFAMSGGGREEGRGRREGRIIS